MPEPTPPNTGSLLSRLFGVDPDKPEAGSPNAEEVTWHVGLPPTGPVTTAEPVPEAAAVCCPSCQALRPAGVSFCGDCGFMFPEPGQAAIPAAGSAGAIKPVTALAPNP